MAQDTPRWPQKRPERLQNRTKTWPKEPEDGSRSAQDVSEKNKRFKKNPKNAPDSPKMAPDSPQDGPRYRQDGPKDAQDGPKSGQKGPNTAPGIAQEGLKMAQRMLISHKVNLRKTSSFFEESGPWSPKMAQDRRQDDPRESQRCSKTARNVP